MVERFIQDYESAELLMTTTTTLVVALGVSAVEGLSRIGDGSGGGLMYESSLDTVSGDR